MKFQAIKQMCATAVRVMPSCGSALLLIWILGGGFTRQSEVKQRREVATATTEPRVKMVQTPYGEQEKFRLVYEIGLLKEDGTPWTVYSRPFTLSYHEKSGLRKHLRSWMGRELTPEESKNFDTEDLVGRTAYLTVVHEHRDGKEYGNIALIQPDKSAQPLKPSGKFIRMKDRPTATSGNGGGGQGGYRRAEQVGANGDDLGATKIHVGKSKGLELRDLAPEQVGTLLEYWLPTAKKDPKPTADDRRLIAALESWQAAQPGAEQAEGDDVPY